MTHGDAPRVPADGGARRWNADRLRTSWPGVYVDVVEVEPCANGRRVRAVVHLGGLTPADVLVSLTPADTSEAARCATDQRLWSSESFDNGRFLFERVLSAGEQAAGDAWMVCVRPAEPSTGRPVLYPLRLEPPHLESG